jgi:ABC-type transport system involved in cytochrome bd biosynthesis fused ATPase/permease subunit
MKDVQIIVAGECGSGKSTLVALIEKTLQQAGYAVDVVNNNSAEDLRKRIIRANDQHLISANAASVNVSIEERQVNRKAAAA